MSWPSVLERCEALYAEAAERHERVWIRGGADTAGAIDSVQARTGFPTGGDRSVGKRVG
jgi:hypothetical protein